MSLDLIEKLVDRLVSMWKSRKEKKRKLFVDFVEPSFAEFQQIHNYYVEAFRKFRSKLGDSDFDLDLLVSNVNEECVFSTTVLSKLRGFSLSYMYPCDDEPERSEFWTFYAEIHSYLTLVDEGDTPHYRQRWFRSFTYGLKEIQLLNDRECGSYLLRAGANPDTLTERIPTKKALAVILLDAIILEMQSRFEMVAYRYGKLKKQCLE